MQHPKKADIGIWMTKGKYAEGPMRISHGQAAMVISFIGAGLLFFALGRISGRFWDSQQHYASRGWSAIPGKADTLVVYNYANRDWEYPRNFAFFVQHGKEWPQQHSFKILLQNALWHSAQLLLTVVITFAHDQSCCQRFLTGRRENAWDLKSQHMLVFLYVSLISWVSSSLSSLSMNFTLTTWSAKIDFSVYKCLCSHERKWWSWLCSHPAAVWSPGESHLTN